MNSDELESYLLMIFNLKNTVNNGQLQYNKLLKNNNNQKNKKLNTVNNDYNEKYKKLNHYTPLTDEVIKKYKSLDQNVERTAKIICKILSIVIGFLVFSKLYNPWFTIPAVVGFATYFVLDSYILPFFSSFIERRIKYSDSKINEENIARSQDQSYFNQEISKARSKLEKNKQYILTEHKRIDNKIRSKYQSVYSKLDNEAKKLEVYLPSEFRNLDIIASLYGILNAGFGDNWKEIINVYRDQRNMNELKSHISDIQNTLNNMNNNILNNQKETIQAINNQSFQQKRLLKEINVGVQQSNSSIKELNTDINSSYDKIQSNQKEIQRELADMNPKKSFTK
ncbi:hypothetical protein [Staphylococcus epidermidis]|uniref:hypothetical protein n=1 Tax=Staphylococcus epidermidis TaxID=1282 RepID=UPI001C527C7B|nr:hypothetical protein [Staphylococcus epidermidis]